MKVIRSRYGSVILAGIFFGTTGTAQALGPDGISTMAVGSARLIFGAALLWAFALATGKSSVKTQVKIGTVDLWLAAVGMALYQLTFFGAVRSTGVAIGTVTALGCAPALTGIIAFIITREKPSQNWFIATIITTIGIVFLASAKGFAHFNLIGFALAICASASYSLFAVVTKRALQSGAQIADSLAKVFGLAALLALPFLFTGGIHTIVTVDGLLMIGWLGLIPTALAYVLYSYGLHAVPASTASTLILAEPATATILAAVVLNESLLIRSWIGIAVVSAGLVYLSRS